MAGINVAAMRSLYLRCFFVFMQICNKIPLIFYVHIPRFLFNQKYPLPVAPAIRRKINPLRSLSAENRTLSDKNVYVLYCLFYIKSNLFFEKILVFQAFQHQIPYVGDFMTTNTKYSKYVIKKILCISE